MSWLGASTSRTLGTITKEMFSAGRQRIALFYVDMCRSISALKRAKIRFLTDFSSFLRNNDIWSEMNGILFALLPDYSLFFLKERIPCSPFMTLSDTQRVCLLLHYKCITLMLQFQNRVIRFKRRT